MQDKFPDKTLKTHTVRNKFNIIIVLIIFILLISLGNFWFSTKVLSGIRAYVAGEGLWSKSQKEAVNRLVKYTITRDEADYSAFVGFTKVQLGDKQARLELDKPHPNLEIARDGFIQGGNNDDDIGNLIFLYRRFRSVSYMDSAIQTWTEGDKEIENLLSTGNQIHNLILKHQDAANLQELTNNSSKLNSLVRQTYKINSRLTTLENQFSYNLGDAYRNISNILLKITISLTILLGALTLIVAILIAKALIRLDILKSEFVSIASHQLRTPLTTINWYAESLLSGLKGKLNDEQRKYIEELYGGGQRMSSLIDDLLKMSSLDLETYVSKRQPVDVSMAINTVIKDLKVGIEHKAITLTMAIDPNMREVILDKQLLGVVLQNLLSNSVKYTPQSGQIAVKADKKNSHILLAISDSGIGIPKIQQTKIFTKLFRADNADKLSSDGSGLGLYIVKATVARMGGKIWFESIEGKGTTFYVKIPFKGGRHAKKLRRTSG